MSEAVHGAVDGAVRGAVSEAVRGAMDGAWWRHLGGRVWASWWAWRAFFRDVTDLDLGVWDLLDAGIAANSAGWWWPHTDFVIVCDTPTSIVRERVGADGWGSHRLHNPTGPSIEWRDGWRLWHWHGVQVPEWVIVDPTLERIQAEENTEVRRCAIEAYGWDRYLDELGVTPVDEADDPGNPGHRLRLFDLPREAQLYPEPVRLLVMDNASRDRDGTRRSFAETVPATCTDAVSAAAWQFDVPVDTYRQLERAT